MAFNLPELKQRLENIEKKHSAIFNPPGEAGAFSIHDVYYVYFNSRQHHLRFTTNTNLPEYIKEEIRTAYENYKLASEQD